jgi:hypothetical protein
MDLNQHSGAHMPELDLERYQDSAQGRASIRRMDQWGNEPRPVDDFTHDYDNPIDLAARRIREQARRSQLKTKIHACMAHMELVCPPKRGAA